jgi:predicted Zn-dependent peptidase
LAYAPDTWSYRTEQFGLFGVYADVDIDDIDDALLLIKREMTSLTEHYLSEELLEKSRLKILLRSVQGYESNSEFADYYSTQYVLFKKTRNFENVEQKIESVTPDDIERVIKQYLSDDKAVTIYETPTLTYSQLYLILSLLLLIIILAVFVSYIRVHGHLKNKLK